jgi:hypothetical protein
MAMIFAAVLRGRTVTGPTGPTGAQLP